jgi:hypothetical protein
MNRGRNGTLAFLPILPNRVLTARQKESGSFSLSAVSAVSAERVRVLPRVLYADGRKGTGCPAGRCGGTRAKLCVCDGSRQKGRMSR